MGQRESRTSPAREYSYAGIQRSDEQNYMSCVGGDRAVTGAPPKYEVSSAFTSIRGVYMYGTLVAS